MTIAEAEERWRRTLTRGWLRFVPSAGSLFAATWALLGLLVIVKFVRTRIQLARADDGDEWRE